MGSPLKKENANDSKAFLSKSRFCTGVQCLKALYLKVHEPGLSAPVDAGQQMIFDQGTAVGIEARKRYPNGILIDQDHFHSREGLADTSEALKKTPPAIFEAALSFHNTLVRIDILKNNGDGTWDIVEVKSTTKFKEEHIPDLSIQRYVAEGAGLKIARTVLMHLNRECVYPDLKNLFAEVDCTREVSEALDSVSDHIDKMLSMLGAKSAPKTKIGPHCDDPYECGFKSNCWSDIPEHSVFELNGVWASTKFDLYHQGLILIKDIPKGKKVSRAKIQQIDAVRTGKPVLDKKGLKSFTEQFEYPLYFFDFETMNPAIPTYAGLSPYSQYAFQFSCHILEKDGAELQHVEYLADGTGDPRAEVCKRMLEALGTNGTILAFNDTFEKTRIKELAEQFPQLKKKLLNLIPRFMDLRDAFSKYYYHPDFHGSLSVKDVLPVLVPEMTYDGMAVADGGGAQVAYLKLADPTLSPTERAVLRNDLLEYCKQDTLALAKLLARVKEILKGKA